MSQQTLASALKVSFPTFNRWENGKTHPDKMGLHMIEQFVKSQGKKLGDLHDRYFKDGTALTADRAKRKKGARADEFEAQTSPVGVMDIKSMEGMLWKAACSIRGEKDAPKFKDYILPLIFIKRLSDVFEDELARLSDTYGSQRTATDMLAADHSLVRFYIPNEATWPVISRRRTFEWPVGKKPKTLGEQITGAIRAITRANSTLQGVIDIVDYNETRNGEREISDEALERLVETLSDPRYRLGLKDVEPDFLGRAYEYLLRKFAESQGQSAGEFFTPQEVGWLMAYLMSPQQGEEVHDPCCGSGGLLVKCELALMEREKPVRRPLRLYGQELTGSSFAIARMNMVLHDMEGEIVRGNTMTNPKFLTGPKLKQFDVVVTNPMWNQDNFDPAVYDSDPYGRFEGTGGFAPGSSADWAWLQHVLNSLKETGRAAVVLDTGAGSRGSGNQGENKEKAIRRWFVDHDLVEGVILMPDNLFYNTTAAGLIVILNKAKPAGRKGKVLLVNAGAEFEKGRPKNFIPMDKVRRIAEAFKDGREIERFIKVVSNEDIAAKNDYNLSPSRYIDTAIATEHRDIQAILDDLGKLDSEAAALDGELEKIFGGLGYRWKGSAAS
jgi:type I restriction enzyme M protein